MAESINDSSPAFPPGLATVPPSEDGDLYARYLHRLDQARKIVAVAAVVCSIGSVVCDLCLIGVLACFVATLALIIESLTRPAPSCFGIRSLLLRWLLVAAVTLAFGWVYGIVQGIGAFVATSLLLGSLREHGVTRVILGALAMALLVAMDVGAHCYPYEYLRWHTRKIEQSSLVLMDQFRATHGQSPTVEGVADALEMSPSDPGLPRALRWLQASRIYVEADRVTVFVEQNPLSLSDAMLQVQIHRQPPPKIQGYAVEYPGTRYGTWLTERVWLKVY